MPFQMVSIFWLLVTALVFDSVLLQDNDQVYSLSYDLSTIGTDKPYMRIDHEVVSRSRPNDKLWIGKLLKVDGSFRGYVYQFIRNNRVILEIGADGYSVEGRRLAPIALNSPDRCKKCPSVAILMPRLSQDELNDPDLP